MANPELKKTAREYRLAGEWQMARLIDDVAEVGHLAGFPDRLPTEPKPGKPFTPEARRLLEEIDGEVFGFRGVSLQDLAPYSNHDWGKYVSDFRPDLEFARTKVGDQVAIVPGFRLFERDPESAGERALVVDQISSSLFRHKPELQSLVNLDILEVYEMGELALAYRRRHGEHLLEAGETVITSTPLQLDPSPLQHFAMTVNNDQLSFNGHVRRSSEPNPVHPIVYVLPVVRPA